MSYSIFYSWQSDSPTHCNRKFIRDALTQAIKQLNADAHLEDAGRLDSDMEDVSGSPEVATIMFQKIQEASLFVGDVTLTGFAKRADGGERRLPNSNVSVELGFAAGVLGWERAICVMNEFFGGREQQPFDVRNRRFPINYKLTPGADRKAVQKAFERLVKDFESALRVAEKSKLLKVDDAIRRLDASCLKTISAHGRMEYFAEHSEIIKENPGAIPRLLDLGLIYTHVLDRMYAYHWTYLGRKVVEKKFAVDHSL